MFALNVRLSAVNCVRCPLVESVRELIGALLIVKSAGCAKAMLRICVKTVVPPRLPVSVSCSSWKAAPKYPLLNVKGDAALMVAGFPEPLKIAFGDETAPAG